VRQHYPEAEIELVRSGGGVFEVVLNGSLIYSKRATGRHCTPEEILQLLGD